MTGTETIRPNADTVVNPGWTVTGAATHWQALSDGAYPAGGADGTYSRNATNGNGILLNLADPATIPAGDLRYHVQIKVRGWRGANFNSLRAVTQVGDVKDSNLADDWQLKSGVGNVETRDGVIRILSPMGQRWTRDDLKNLGIVLWANYAVDVTVAELWVVITWWLPPAVTVTAPVGTQLTTRPTFGWSYTQEDLLPQDRARLKVFAQSVYQAPGFDPETSPAAYDSGELLGAVAQHTPTADILNGTYRCYVKAASTVDGAAHWSTWSYLGFTIALDAPSAPVLLTVPELAEGRVRLEVTGTDNLLTAQDASFEDAAGGVGNWSGAFTNANLARSTAQALHGSASMTLTSVAAGDMTAYLADVLQVQEGQVVEMLADFRAATVARACEAALRFYDDALVQVGAEVAGSAGNDATGAWSAHAGFVATCPAGARWCRGHLRVKATGGAGEVHYGDKVKIAPLLSDWSRGGLANRNRLTVNQADLETDMTGWEAASGCTIAQSGAQAARGTKSGLMTSTVAGPLMAARTNLRVAVVPASQYTAASRLRAVTTGRTIQAGIEWYDAADNLLGTSLGTTGTDTNTGFTQVSCTDVAPANAAFGELVVYVLNQANGEGHYWDENLFAPGDSAIFSPGGTEVTTRLQLEYTDQALDVADADATWSILPGAGDLALDVDQRVVCYDHHAPPDRPRRYQARVVAVDTGVALAGTASSVEMGQLPSDTWRLKDPLQPAQSAHDLWVQGPKADKLTRRAGIHEPLADGTEPDGTVYPVVVGDSVSGWDGPLQIHARYDEDLDEIETLARAQRPLLLVSPFGWQRWIEILDVAIETPGTPTEPRHAVTLQYLEVAAPSTMSVAAT